MLRINPKISVAGNVVRHYKQLKGVDNSAILFDAGSDKAHATINGATVETGLSGLENGETHNGIPQSVNEEWNGYSYCDGISSYIAFSSEQKLDIGESIEVRAYISDENNINISDRGANPMSQLQVLNPNNSILPGVVRFRVRTANRSFGLYYNHSNISITGWNTVKLERINLTQYNFTINGVTELKTVSTSDLEFYYQDYGRILDVNFYQKSLLDYIIAKGVEYKNPDFTGLSKNNLVNIYIPEDLSNPGFDVFGNAITDSIKDSLGNQIWFNLDKESWIDTNWIRSLDRNKPFTILFAYRGFASGQFESIISNLVNNANLPGIEIFKSDSAEKLLATLRNDGTDRIAVTFDELLTNSDVNICMITYAGNSLAAGVKGFIEDTESAKSGVTDNLTSTIVGSQSFLIGKRPDDSNYVEGQISQIQFFEKDLSSKASKKYQELFDILNA